MPALACATALAAIFFAASGTAFSAPADDPGSIGPLPPGGDLPAAPAEAAQGPSDTIAPDGQADPARFVVGEVIVRFKATTSSADRAGLLDARDLEVTERLPVPGASLLELPPGDDVRETVAALEALPGVAYAQPNWLRQTQLLPGVSRLRDLWGLHNTGQVVNGDPAGTPGADISAAEAWDVTTGSRDVVVAVADSGVAYDHPALRSNIWSNADEIAGNGLDDDGNGFIDDIRGWNFIEDNNNPLDDDGHGTHVAGTIGASGDDNSIVGVNWKVSIMPLRVLGGGGGSDAGIAESFAYAADNGADVLNASLGGPGASPLIDDVVRLTPDLLYVVAAGNGGADGVGDNNDTSTYTPCNIPHANLICVAATDQKDQLTGFSNFGRTQVDLGAPGNSTLSTHAPFRTPYFHDFQDANFNFDAGGWTKAPSTSTWGGYDGWTADFGAGFSITDSPGLCFPGLDQTGCYATNASHAAEAPAINLTAMHSCTLSYWLYVDINPAGNFTGDRLEIEASSFSPTQLYRMIHRWNGGPGSPPSNPWVDDFSAFDGRSNVRLVLTMRSDNTYDARDGAHVDNVAVSCLGTNFGAADFDFKNGTSMASPHVAGVAALILSRTRGATVAQLRSALLQTVDAKPDLATATATGGRLNAARAVTFLPADAPPGGGTDPPPGGGTDPPPGGGDTGDDGNDDDATSEACAKAKKKLKAAKKKLRAAETPEATAKAKANLKKAKRTKKRACS